MATKVIWLDETFTFNNNRVTVPGNQVKIIADGGVAHGGSFCKRNWPDLKMPPPSFI